MLRRAGDSGATYEIGPEPLGAGGQALVYPATCADDGARVAVRVARGGGDLALHVARQTARQRALSEGPAGAWVLPVYDEGTWDDRPFAVTPLARPAWAPRGTPGEADADRATLRELLGAVRALRAAGVAHGDLTPGNVLRGEDGALWLADWSVPGTPWFTPGHAPPERLAGRDPEPDADLWGFAATAWTVLAGGLPEGPARLPAAVLAGDPAEIPRCRPTAADVARFAGATGDPALGQLLAAHLDPDPRRRRRDPDALDRALARLPPAAPPRRARYAVGAAAAALALGLGAALAPDPACAPLFRPAGPGRCAHPDGRVTIRVGPGLRALGDAAPGTTDAPPRHAVLTRAVELDRTEVTQAEWRRLTGEDPVRDREQVLDGGVVAPCATWKGHSLVGASMPVVCVTWVEAARFANLRSRADGLRPAYAIDGDEVRWDRAADGWRLPTEAEWEVAARAGGPARIPDPCAAGNLRDASTPERWGDEPFCEDGAPALAPVDAGPENAWGFLGTYGNAGEWTWDRYASEPPRLAVDPAGPDDGPARTWRGGSWMSVPRGLASRGAVIPTSHEFSVGLRLARTAR